MVEEEEGVAVVTGANGPLRKEDSEGTPLGVRCSTNGDCSPDKEGEGDGADNNEESWRDCDGEGNDGLGCDLPAFGREERWTATA